MTQHHLVFLSLKGGCRGSSESTLVEMPHSWISYVTAHDMVSTRENLSSEVCKLHRCRPACTSRQSDQRLCYPLLESIICTLATGEISIFQLVSVAEETGLKLALSETPKTGFLATGPYESLTRRSPNCALILFGLSLAAWAKYDLANSRFFSPPSVYFIWNRYELA